MTADLDTAWRTVLERVAAAGMRVQRCPDDPARCYVTCRTCGWPGEPPDWASSVERVAANDALGCPMCAIERMSRP